MVTEEKTFTPTRLILGDPPHRFHANFYRGKPVKPFGILLILMICLSACAPLPPPAPTPTLTLTRPPDSATATATSMLTPDPAVTASPVPSDPPHLEPFGTIVMEESDIRFDVEGDGRNVDSIAFWESQEPDGSLMFVTSKGNEFIEVYQHPFRSQLRTIPCGDESNGVWVDQERDVLYITRRDSNYVCAYDLPALSENGLLSFSTAAAGGDSEPNLTMLNLPDGRSRIYVSYDDIVFYHDAETGEALGEFEPSEGLETMYGDDYYQVLYIPDEGDRSGVYQYDSDGNPAGPAFGDRSIFDSDAEGISVYRCLSPTGDDTGEGLIVVADQREQSTDFEVFHRSTKGHLGTINIPGVNNTDGIAITQQASPEYPLGLLAVIDDDTSTVGVGWDTIFEKTGLSCGS